MGWFNIYSVVYNEAHKSIFDLSQNCGKQFIWINISIILAFTILMIDPKFFSTFSYPIYILSILLLIAVLIIGKEIAGSKSWIHLGSFAVQPSEFAKFATNLAVAKYLSTLDIKLKNFKTIIKTLIIIGLPTVLIFLQNDTGTALVFFSFFFVLFREGFSSKTSIIIVMTIFLFILTLIVDKFIVISIIAGIILFIFLFIKKNKKNALSLIGILIFASGFSYGVDYVFKNVMQQHQKTRINVLLGKNVDLKGASYNVNQSKIAIGSGGFSGKGFLKGTQTKYNFVPKQSTDFIFCTVGEEWGFVGSLTVILLFIALLTRIIIVAERQRSKFSRIYGYGLASILFFHFAINIGMTIGLAPVVGIPLPFFSYGGSSLSSFTLLLFVFVKQDANRLELM